MSQTDVPYEPVLTPDTAGGRALSFGAKIAVTALMPLFLMTTFILCFVSAGHAPTPHDFALTLAGPTGQTQQLSDQIIDQSDEAAFDFTFTTSADTARQAVIDRAAAGAIVVGESEVTTIVASAGGSTQAALVKSIGTQVGAELALPMTVDEVAPTLPKDAGGTSLFFFLVVCTLGTYLTVTVMSQTAPKARLVPQLGAIIGAAVLSPLIGFSIISAFVGDYGVTFGSVAAVLLVGMLYSFAIGMASLFFSRLAGMGGTLIAMVFLIAMNFPSSGGSTSEATLPPFWQVIHNSWVGSGMLEWIRGILYFDGAQIGRWAPQLLIWAAAGTVAAVVVAAIQDRSRKAPSHPESGAVTTEIHATPDRPTVEMPQNRRELTSTPDRQ